MIHQLHLRNWRSYERLDLRLQPGTTFIVAPNGVGKTSLVYGLAWAVFGQHTDIDPRTCIRAGAQSAEVQVQFELPDGSQLSVNRTVRRRGAPSATYQMNGTTISESSAVIEIERGLGIELSVAGRLSTMLGGGHVAARDNLNLESHLHQAFGVTHLLRAAENAQSIARDAERSRAAFRSTARQQTENRTALENEIKTLEGEITTLSQRSLELQGVRDAAATQRSLVARHLALSGQWQQYEQQRSSLLDMIQNLVGRSTSAGSLEQVGSLLRSELATSERVIANMTESAVTARSVVNSADQAINLLSGDHAVCPTCMRPLHYEERASAISVHRAQQADAQVEASRLEEARSSRQAHAQAVSRLIAQLEALQPPSVHLEDVNVPTQAAADAFYQQAAADLDEHNRHLGGLQSRMEFLKAQIASDDQVQQEERELRRAYRREAAAIAGARVLREAADQVIKTRIEPMATEIRGQWKHLFTNNGLTFGPDGSIARIREGQELGWDTLSGGERTWAKIVTHLIVMGTTTALPFAWFDEPLEHLDPQLRHAVAATLATATRRGSPRQLLVTTYEHGIAQQLADDTDGASIIAIRESGASFSSPE